MQVACPVEPSSKVSSVAIFTMGRSELIYSRCCTGHTERLNCWTLVVRIPFCNIAANSQSCCSISLDHWISVALDRTAMSFGSIFKLTCVRILQEKVWWLMMPNVHFSGETSNHFSGNSSHVPCVDAPNNKCWPGLQTIFNGGNALQSLLLLCLLEGLDGAATW